MLNKACKHKCDSFFLLPKLNGHSWAFFMVLDWTYPLIGRKSFPLKLLSLSLSRSSKGGNIRPATVGASCCRPERRNRNRLALTRPDPRRPAGDVAAVGEGDVRHDAVAAAAAEVVAGTKAPHRMATLRMWPPERSVCTEWRPPAGKCTRWPSDRPTDDCGYEDTK